MADSQELPNSKEPNAANYPLRLYATRTGSVEASYGTGAVRNWAFSPDGNRLAVLGKLGGNECLLDLWPIPISESFHWTQTLNLPFGELYGQVAFSNDGKAVVAAVVSGGNRDQSGVVENGLLEVHEADSGEKESERRLTCVPFVFRLSPDGSSLAVRAEQLSNDVKPSGVRIYDSRSDRPPSEHEETALPIFSHDGSRAVFAGNPATVITVGRSGEPAKTLPVNFSPLTFATGDASLIGRSSERTIVHWDLKQQREVRRFEDQVGAISGFAFSRDGGRFAAADADRILRVWDVATGKLLRKFSDIKDVVDGLSFLDNADEIVSLDAGNELKIWNLNIPPDHIALRGGWPADLSDADLSEMAFTPDLEHLVMRTFYNEIRVWDLTGALEWGFSATEAEWRPQSSFDCSPDGQFIVGAIQEQPHLLPEGMMGDTAICVWSAKTGELKLRLSAPMVTTTEKIYELKIEGSDVRRTEQKITVEFTGPDTRRLVWTPPQGAPTDEPQAASAKSSMWYVRYVSFGGRVVKTLPPPSYWQAVDNACSGFFIRADNIVLSRDGRQCASLPNAWPVSKEVVISNCADGESLFSLPAPDGGIRAVAFHPGGTRLACACADGTVRLWDLESRQELLSLVGHEGEVMAVAFSSDGNKLYSAGVDKTIRIWDATP